MAPPGPEQNRVEPRPLHQCPACDSDLVYPVDWAQTRSEHWSVSLRCPNCEWTACGTFDQALVDAFDEELDGGAEALVRDLRELSRANMADAVDRFAEALRAGAVLPEDF